MSFTAKLQAKWDEGKFVCVGLDSDVGKLPLEHLGLGEPINSNPLDDQQALHNSDYLANAIMMFNEAIIAATRDLVCAYKPNTAFYERLGQQGVGALRYTLRYIRVHAPDVPIILDAKRGDIGNTNNGYVASAFDAMPADAITIHPYLGQEANEPFLADADRGAVVLCRTSNPGAGEFQDRFVHVTQEEGRRWGLEFGASGNYDPIRLYELVALRVAEQWNEHGNCAVVVGATYPAELGQVRDIVGDMPILIPGIGAQGGDLEATVLAGANSRGQGMIINNSRGILFASSGFDFAEVARLKTLEMHDAITDVLAGI